MLLLWGGYVHVPSGGKLPTQPARKFIPPKRDDDILLYTPYPEYWQTDEREKQLTVEVIK